MFQLQQSQLITLFVVTDKLDTAQIFYPIFARILLTQHPGIAANAAVMNLDTLQTPPNAK